MTRAWIVLLGVHFAILALAASLAPRRWAVWLVVLVSAVAGVGLWLCFVIL